MPVSTGATSIGRWRSRLLRTARIVHVHAHAAVFVDGLDAVDVAAVVGDALGAEHLSARAALDPAHAVRQRIGIVLARGVLLARTRARRIRWRAMAAGRR